MTTRISHTAIWAAVACMALPACHQAEFGELRVEQRSNSPLPIDVDDDQVALPMGVAVTLKVKPVSGNDQRYTANDGLEFESNNPSVMGAFQIRETSEVVVTGVRPGRTCLRVIVNDEEVTCLDVRVTEQAIEPERDR